MDIFIFFNHAYYFLFGRDCVCRCRICNSKEFIVYGGAMRHVFFSFDWDDVWRVNQVRHSWVAKGSYTAGGFVDSAQIETLKRNTDHAIKRWIGKQINFTPTG